MHTVLLYGSDKDRLIKNTLLGTIRSAGCSILQIAGKNVSMIPPHVRDPDFLLLDNADINSFHINKGAVVFMPDIPVFKNNFHAPEHFYAIVDPSNEEAIEIIRKNNMQAITCGLSQKDTFTFSSIDQDKAVVSLQRELFSLDGGYVEPSEIPVCFHKMDSDYGVLSSIAVLMLSGVKFDRCLEIRCF